MAYSPKYVNLDEVPVRQVPDDYDRLEKEDALEFAESSLELDVYNGEAIPDDEISTMVVAAVKQKATCELVKGAEDPTSVKLGDLSDDGTTKADYANTFCNRYDEIVEKINDTGTLEEGDSIRRPYVYNTSPDDNDC